MIRDTKLGRIQSWVKTQVSPLRYAHIQGVVKTAERLAVRHGLSLSQARLAAWLHDCGKELSRREMLGWLRHSRFKLDNAEKTLPGLWHPHVAAAIAVKMWRINDTGVLEAVRCHTLGKPRMRPLSCLLFVADFIEPGRKFPGVQDARKAADQSLAAGVLQKSSRTISFLLEKRMLIHPRLLETWNYYLKAGRT